MIWGRNEYIAIFTKALLVIFFLVFKTILKIAQVWWLMATNMEVTVCIFESFVYDLGILYPCKILWFCKDGICLWTSWHGVQRNRLLSLQKHFPSIFLSLFSQYLTIAKMWQLVLVTVTVCIFDMLSDDPRKIMWFCKDSICLWASVHKVQRSVLQSLQKHVQSIFFSLCFQNNSQNSLSLMTSDKYYEGNHLTALWLSHPCTSNSMILQQCDLGTLDLGRAA